MHLENPLLVGAGWDKKGRAVNGLYSLGFAGVEVGTVPLFGQPGNPKPRMATINREHSVGMNWLGFNSPGSEVVERNLENQSPILGRLGINIGKNKDMRDDLSPWAHGEVVRRLYRFADYFVFNPSSPNTKDLRELQKKEPLRDHLRAMLDVMDDSGGRKPLFVKFAPDLPYEDFDASLEVLCEEGAAGTVLTNTTINTTIKSKYGSRWANQAGGLSGDDEDYRAMVVERIRHTYELHGDKLIIIGAGAVKDADTALLLIRAGAAAVQIVTAMRPSLGKVAAQTNIQLVQHLQGQGITNIRELVGASTVRGPLN